MNVLKPHLQTTIATLLATGTSQREIERDTRIDRKTIRTYQQRLTAERANSPTLATGSSGGDGLGVRALPRVRLPRSERARNAAG